VKDDPTVGRNHSTLGATLDGLAEGHNARGEYAEAAKLLAEAIACGEKAVELSPQSQFRRFLFTHLINTARVRVKLNDSAGALAAAQRAEGVLGQLRGLDDERVGDWAEWRLVELHRVIAQVHDAAGRKVDTAREALRWLDTAKRIVALAPADPRAVAGVGDAFEVLIHLEPAKAAEWREQEVAYWREQCKARPADRAAALAGATAAVERGELAVAEQRWATALKWFEPALAELTALAAKHPADAEVTERLGYALKWTGDIRWHQKNTAGAVEAWRAGVEVYRRRLLAAPDDVVIYFTLGGLLHNLGLAESEAGRNSRAVGLLTDALTYQSWAFARNPKKCRQWMDNHLSARATVYREMGRWADAMADTAARAELWPTNAEVLLELAGNAAALAESAGGPQWGEWSTAAVGWIRDAIRHGASPRAVAADERFEGLRAWPDFRAAVGLPPVAPPPRAVVK
jgi:tetratricopeptide (TPR) repeat protein